MDNKISVTISAPLIDKTFDFMIPVDKNIYEILLLIKKGVPELSKGYYEKNIFMLYNETDGSEYSLKTIVKKSNITSGSKLIII